jgi:hypothetical protein
MPARHPRQETGRPLGDPRQKPLHPRIRADRLGRVELPRQLGFREPGVNFLVTDMRPYVANAPTPNYT